MAKSKKTSEKLSKKESSETSEKGGRPSKYTAEIAEKICLMIASSTYGLRRICKENLDMPSPETICRWRARHPEFCQQYARAREVQADLLAEEIIDIADDDSQDQMLTETGIKPNAEFIQRSRLRIEARKWMACKLLPKIYGDKSEVLTTSIEDEELKATINQIKNSVEVLKKYERDF